MQDTQVSLSVPLSRIAAWGAWVVMVALLAIGIAIEEQGVLAAGLAMSAVAATCHIRCFCIRLSREVHAIADVVQRQSGAPAAPRGAGLSAVMIEKD